MGPDYTDHVFIMTGAVMMIAGVVLYFTMEIWPQIKADASVSAAQPVFMSFGLLAFTNGWTVGYGAQMHIYVLVALTVVMIASLVWCCFAMLKLGRAVYGKQQSRLA